MVLRNDVGPPAPHCRVRINGNAPAREGQIGQSRRYVGSTSGSPHRVEGRGTSTRWGAGGSDTSNCEQLSRQDEDRLHGADPLDHCADEGDAKLQSAGLDQMEDAAHPSPQVVRDQGEPVAALLDQRDGVNVLLNLVGNAVQYTPPGGHVHVALRRETGWATIQVCDDGIGITAQALPHLFERFYRADAAHGRGGVGLGLSIAQWIVEAHGGQIRVESTPSRGSTFTVRLPNAQPISRNGRPLLPPTPPDSRSIAMKPV